MADTESKSWTILKGVGGVSGAVITAILIYHFTRPDPTPPAPIVIPPVAVNGFVADADSHRLLRNASVTIALGSNKVQQFTDESGRYSVVLAAVGSAADMGTVDIKAPGYLPFTNSVPLHPGDNFAEITLDAIPPPPAAPPASVPAGPPPSATATPPAPTPTTTTAIPPQSTFNPASRRAAIMVRTPPPNYVKKAVTEYVGVKHP